MNTSDSTHSKFPRISNILIACSFITILALFVVKYLSSPTIPFISHDHVQWIMCESEPQALAIFSNLKDPPEYVYKTAFNSQTNRTTLLHVRALRTFRLFVNNHFVGQNRNQSDWKKTFTFDITNHLRFGHNKIEIYVQNPWGPGLLQAYTRGLGREVTTNKGWKVEFEGKTSNAIRATDIIQHPDSRRYSSLEILKDEWPVVLILFVSTAIFLSLAKRHFKSSDKKSQLPKLALISITALWALLFTTKFSQIPLNFGFDGDSHLHYISYILNKHSIPLPNEGLSTYHPPLFYCLSAFIFMLLDSLFGTNTADLGLKAIPFLSGLGNVWIAYFASRKLFNNDPKLVTLTVLAAGLIPMNIYMSAYVSNESLHAFLISAAVFCLITVILEQQTRLRTVIVLGLLTGLALLTKYTAAIVLPLIFLFLIYKLVFLEKAETKRIVTLVVAFLSIVTITAGWFYARNILNFGRPFVGNWEPIFGDKIWWQQPGFHTIDYYIHFGKSITNPFFAGTVSFWDGMYSTFWGDGYVHGQMDMNLIIPQWNYDYMLLTYLFATPCVIIGPIGLLSAIRNSQKLTNIKVKTVYHFAIMFITIMVIAILLVTLRLPYLGQTKAFYGLSVIIPLSLVIAEILARIDRFVHKYTALRLLYYGWLGVLAFMIILSYAA